VLEQAVFSISAIERMRSLPILIIAFGLG